MIQLPQQTLVVASHNSGKVREIQALLEQLPLKVVSAADLDLPEPHEPHDTFVENAVMKAEAASQASGLAALADDSGLSILALDGQPGVHSARWAGDDRNFAMAFQRVEEALAVHTDRRAYFTCVLALAIPGQATQVFEATYWGVIDFPARGDHGFGYDPIFIPDGFSQTLAELGPDVKRSISARTQAFTQLMDACFR